MNAHESLVKDNYPCNYVATLWITFILKVTLWSWYCVAALATLVTIVLSQGSFRRRKGRQRLAEVVVTLEGDSRAHSQKNI